MKSQNSQKPLPSFFIGSATTMERINDYLTHKHSLLSQVLGKPDTKSIWYSKEHIAKLLEEIENCNGDGLRIYFGSYESTHEFAGQTCLLMNVTREKQNGTGLLHVDVKLEEEENFSNRSELSRDIINPDAGNTTNESKKDYNFGSPCPPRCDGGL
jgi:hypothetical protein